MRYRRQKLEATARFQSQITFVSISQLLVKQLDPWRIKIQPLAADKKNFYHPGETEFLTFLMQIIEYRKKKFHNFLILQQNYLKSFQFIFFIFVKVNNKIIKLIF